MNSQNPQVDPGTRVSDEPKMKEVAKAVGPAPRLPPLDWYESDGWSHDIDSCNEFGSDIYLPSPTFTPTIVPEPKLSPTTLPEVDLRVLTSELSLIGELARAYATKAQVDGPSLNFTGVHGPNTAYPYPSTLTEDTEEWKELHDLELRSSIDYRYPKKCHCRICRAARGEPQLPQAIYYTAEIGFLPDSEYLAPDYLTEAAGKYEDRSITLSKSTLIETPITYPLLCTGRPPVITDYGPIFEVLDEELLAVTHDGKAVFSDIEMYFTIDECRCQSCAIWASRHGRHLPVKVEAAIVTGPPPTPSAKGPIYIASFTDLETMSAGGEVRFRRIRAFYEVPSESNEASQNDSNATSASESDQEPTKPQI
ncbi:hypothetical protein N431DRAFT_468178 [Stipitochalara longipes BDJ]|nr:hypothetical protein N431DRAFT_468178 [Stipitochalara longipes BDJ]